MSFWRKLRHRVSNRDVGHFKIDMFIIHWLYSTLYKLYKRQYGVRHLISFTWRRLIYAVSKLDDVVPTI